MSKCEQIYYRYLGRSRNPFSSSKIRKKKIVCDNESTTTLERVGSEYPRLNGPINVCDKHVKDVEMTNWLLEARNSGELDRMICEAEGHTDDDHLGA